MAGQNERRAYPRLKDSRVSLKLQSDQFDSTISQSLDISASGVYCKIDKEVPLMSRVKIILMMPLDPNKRDSKTQKIETEGVVVREHPVIENGKIVHYDVAIFFDSLAAKDRETIKEYVGNKLK